MIDQAVLQAAADVIALLGKGILSAGLVTALSWFTLEWVLFPLRKMDEITKRYVTLIVGMALVFLAHWSGIVNYGAGPHGWAAAFFFGFIGGGLAPRFHEMIKKRLPGLVNAPTEPTEVKP